MEHGAWASCGPHTPACWTTLWQLQLCICLLDVPLGVSLTLKIPLVPFPDLSLEVLRALVAQRGFVAGCGA